MLPDEGPVADRPQEQAIIGRLIIGKILLPPGVVVVKVHAGEVTFVDHLVKETVMLKPITVGHHEAAHR